MTPKQMRKLAKCTQPQFAAITGICVSLIREAENRNDMSSKTRTIYRMLQYIYETDRIIFRGMILRLKQERMK